MRILDVKSLAVIYDTGTCSNSGHKMYQEV